MRVQSLGRVLVVVGLAIALAGCAAAGQGNTQVTTGAVTTSAAAPSTNTVVITRTVLVTSTVFATVTVGSSAASALTSTSIAPSTTTAATSSTVVSSVESTPTAHKTPTPEPNSLPVAGAANVTLDFLAALEKDPSGTTSLQYLSTRLQGVVHSGHSVASIVGIQKMYSHYQAEAAVSRGGGRAATVNVTLTFASGPVMRIVTLIPEGGAWRIDDISPTSA